ncbi:unnamed protein product [Paramecium pentaurelia]|uniref:Uncharacterized protein n=1 Tax=Paramecium pentaurelia TaxID=43138 RepID=A0A8S1YGS0_9CILI|nr:unnamed protein product [Paramecium pentaurelia]
MLPMFLFMSQEVSQLFLKIIYRKSKRIIRRWILNVIIFVGMDIQFSNQNNVIIDVAILVKLKQIGNINKRIIQVFLITLFYLKFYQLNSPKTISDNQEFKLSFSQQLHLNVTDISEEQYVQMIIVVTENTKEYNVEVTPINSIIIELTDVAYKLLVNFKKNIPVLKQISLQNVKSSQITFIKNCSFRQNCYVYHFDFKLCCFFIWQFRNFIESA